MSSSGSILPIPKWYFVDNNGEPLGGGFLYTMRSIDKIQVKPVFQDSALTIPYIYTNTDKGPAIKIDANGTIGPIFWADDEPYYIFVTDMFGVTIWTMDGFGPAIAGGGGGGGGTTTTIDIENLIINGTFYRNGIPGGTPIGPSNDFQSITPVPQFLTIAPGAHAGLSGVSTAVNGSPAPDICFIKNTSTATDTLSFGTFPVGGDDFGGNDSVPVNYLRYVSNAGSDTFKYVQFPITSDASSLSNTPVKGYIWARWNGGAATQLQLFFRVFYGSGSHADPDLLSPEFIINLNTADTNWHQYMISMTVPDSSGKNLGQCGNDGLFFQVQYPPSVDCNIDFVKPVLFVGDITPTRTFLPNDDIESIINDFRTGDVRSSINSFAPYGWVPMNDGTIGSSLATTATTRANKDTFPLYNLLWNNVGSTFAPMGDGLPYGTDAVTDFTNNRAITLTRSLGRVLAGAGPATTVAPILSGHILGEFLGSEGTSDIPHHHHITNIIATNVKNAVGESDQVSLQNTFTIPLASGDAINDSGGNVVNVVSIMQPTTFLNQFIKL